MIAFDDAIQLVHRAQGVVQALKLADSLGIRNLALGVVLKPVERIHLQVLKTLLNRPGFDYLFPFERIVLLVSICVLSVYLHHEIGIEGLVDHILRFGGACVVMGYCLMHLLSCAQDLPQHHFEDSLVLYLL